MHAVSVLRLAASDMAAHARRVAADNGLSSCITVLQGRMGDVELPCKVACLAPPR